MSVKFGDFISGTLKLLVATAVGSVLAGVLAYQAVGYFVRGEVIRTPDLVGLSAEDALGALKEADLFLLLDQHVRSETIRAGGITWQNPPAGREIKRWSQVLVRVSEGSGTIRVAPEWTGMSRDKAIGEIEEAGSRVGAVTVIRAENGVARDVVLSTDPPGGFDVPLKGSIGLLVAAENPAGERYIPNLFGITVVEATRDLAEVGLSGRVVEKMSAPESEPGRILDQYPAAGTRTAGVTEVELVIAAHPSDLPDSAADAPDEGQPDRSRSK